MGPTACGPEGLVLLLEGVGLNSSASDDLLQDTVKTINPQFGKYNEDLKGCSDLSPSQGNKSRWASMVSSIMRS